jgi:hypothetical protein
MFSDKVSAMEGASTGSFVTVVEDGSDKYLPEACSTTILSFLLR